MKRSRPWPDYGEPGAPGMDPYYISPEQERHMEAERLENIEETIEAYQSDLAGMLFDLRSSLLKYGRDLASGSITINLETLVVTIKV